jgi:hypothetical protein
MQTYLNMQTSLRSHKGGRGLLAAAFLVLLGLTTQVHGAAKLFFISDGTTTKSNATTIVAPVVTNTVEAKVVVVNREDQTFTIEHQGKLHLFHVEPGTPLFNARGKRTTLDWVTAGQTVSIKAIERQSGRLDLLAANLLPSRAQLQAAGKKAKAAPAPEPVIFPSEDARPHVLEETPLPTETPTPAPTDNAPQPAPTDPQVENPQPQPEPAPENPQPTEEPK